jgi:hypothetical protein
MQWEVLPHQPDIVRKAGRQEWRPGELRATVMRATLREITRSFFGR